MKINVLLTALLLSLSFVSSFAQTGDALQTGYGQTVNGKINAYHTRDKAGVNKTSTEEDLRLWKEFKSDELGFRISFPTPVYGRVNEQRQRNLTLLEIKTERAQYGLMRMVLPTLLTKGQLENLYESIIPTAASGGGKTTVIEKRDVQMEGSFGKQIIYEEAGQICFARFYIIEHNFYVLRASIDLDVYTADFDRWAIKFLDSFGAKTDDKLVA